MLSIPYKSMPKHSQSLRNYYTFNPFVHHHNLNLIISQLNIGFSCYKALPTFLNNHCLLHYEQPLFYPIAQYQSLSSILYKNISSIHMSIVNLYNWRVKNLLRTIGLGSTNHSTKFVFIKSRSDSPPPCFCISSSHRLDLHHLSSTTTSTYTYLRSVVMIVSYPLPISGDRRKKRDRQ